MSFPAQISFPLRPGYVPFELHFEGLPWIGLREHEEEILSRPRILVTGWNISPQSLSLLGLMSVLHAPRDAELVGWAMVESLQRNEGRCEPFEEYMLHVVLNDSGSAAHPEDVHPVVFWRGNHLRASVIQRILSLEGYLHHSRLEEWQRGA